MAYLAYVVSELFHFSGIIGIIACGLFQTHYTMLNLTGKGYISINYIIKFLRFVFYAFCNYRNLGVFFLPQLP